MKDWNVLKNQKIIDLLIGDSIIKDDSIFHYKMPYMSGNDIYDFARKLGKNEFSLPKASRWVYMSEILDDNNFVDLNFKNV